MPAARSAAKRSKRARGSRAPGRGRASARSRAEYIVVAVYNSSSIAIVVFYDGNK